MTTPTTEPQQIKIGPLKFVYWPDGQDPGAGMLIVTTDTFAIETKMGAITRAEWEQFTEEGRR